MALIMDAVGTRVAYYAPQNIADNHNGGSNVLFEDGHASWVKDVKGRFAPPTAINNSEQGAMWTGHTKQGETVFWP